MSTTPTVPPDSPPPAPRRRHHAHQSPASLAVPGAWLKLSTIAEVTGLGRSTLYAMIRRGDFVQGVRVTGKAMRYPATEVRGWMEKRGLVAPDSFPDDTDPAKG